jgi:hypothetical protein
MIEIPTWFAYAALMFAVGVGYILAAFFEPKLKKWEE